MNNKPILKNNKRGESSELSMMPVITLLVAVALVLLPLLSYVTDIGSDEGFDRAFLARDIGILINTGIGIQNNFILDYTQNLTGFVYVEDKDTFLVRDSDAQSEVLISGLSVFKDKKQNYKFDSIDASKQNKPLVIKKDSNDFVVREMTYNLTAKYYLPELIDDFKYDNLAVVLIGTDEVENGYNMGRLGAKFSALNPKPLSSKYTMDLEFRFYQEDDRNGAVILVPRDNDNLAVIGASIVNEITDFSKLKSLSFDPLYVKKASDAQLGIDEKKDNKNKIVIMIGNPDIKKEDNFLARSNEIEVLLKNVILGVESAFIPEKLYSEKQNEIAESVDTTVQTGVKVVDETVKLTDSVLSNPGDGS